MPLNLRFAFVCEKQWNELTGDDGITRHCATCDRTITNLDPLSEAERAAFFRDAITCGTKPCVFATVPVEGAEPCEAGEELPLGIMTGGEPIMDDDDDYALPDDSGDEDGEIKFDF
jgi:hypothetical protein